MGSLVRIKPCHVAEGAILMIRGDGKWLRGIPLDTGEMHYLPTSDIFEALRFQCVDDARRYVLDTLPEEWLVSIKRVRVETYLELVEPA